MKQYELSYLISGEITEQEAKDFQNRIASIIKEMGGVLDETGLPLKKRLAYSIKKQIQAYLAVLIFKMDPEKITELEKKIKEEHQILRHLMLYKKPLGKKAEKARRVRPLRKPLLTEEKKPLAEKKVELKEIEKKLEEILQE
jgi:ribosomal protein S6